MYLHVYVHVKKI